MSVLGIHFRNKSGRAHVRNGLIVICYGISLDLLTSSINLTIQLVQRAVGIKLNVRVIDTKMFASLLFRGLGS